MYNRSGVNRPNVTDIVIVFTDGNSAIKSKTEKQAKRFRQKDDVKVFAIGAARKLSSITVEFKNELKKIASKEEYVILEDLKTLPNVIKPLVNKICVPVNTSPPPPCERDILFIVDGSANPHIHWLKKNEHFEEMKGFVEKVISGLHKDHFKIGVMQFGGKSGPTMEVDFTINYPNIPVLKSTIKKIKQHDGTARRMGEALEMAGNELYKMNAIHDRYDAEDVIVLITRGKILDESKAKSEIKMLQRRNVSFITIGVGSRPQYMKDYLVDIFSPQYVNVSKYKGLKDNARNVPDKICTKNFIGEPGQNENGTTICGNKPYDIFFVIDGSASISRVNFNKVRKFIMDSLVLLKINSSNISIGFMQFSEKNKTKILLELGKHSKKEELNLVQRMKYQSGQSTMLGDALSHVNDKIFTGKNGDRPYAENIMILLSDGNAHDIEKAYKEAEKLKTKRNGAVRVVTVAAGRNVLVDNLKKIASGPDDLLKVQYSDLYGFAEKAILAVCNSSKKEQHSVSLEAKKY